MAAQNSNTITASSVLDETGAAQKEHPVTPPPEINPRVAPASELQKFWSRVNKSGPVPELCPELGPCWIWTGPLSKKGYGLFSVARLGRNVRAHRYSFELHSGNLPQDKPYVCHKCDTPGCVKPAHLFAGDTADNVHDSIKKGKSFVGGPNHHFYRSDIPEAAVVSLYEEGVSPLEIASHFHCSTTLIRNRLKTAGLIWPRPLRKFRMTPQAGSTAAQTRSVRQQAALNLYKTGTSVREIANQFQCHVDTVQRWLIALGAVPHQPRSAHLSSERKAHLSQVLRGTTNARFRQDISTDDIFRLKTEGHSFKQIASRLGTRPGLIVKRYYRELPRRSA
jgi:hypothetical protein